MTEFFHKAEAVKCPPFRLIVQPPHLGMVRVSTRLDTSDSLTGQPIKVATAKVLTEEQIYHMDDHLCAKFLFDLVTGHALHELSEAFEYNGQRPFWPH